MTMKHITILTVAMGWLMSATIFGDDLAEMRKYQYGGDRAAMLAVERQVEAAMANRATQRRMAAALLELLIDRQATPAARQHAAILLRMCGTDAEVPALARLLGEGSTGDWARGALERIPGDAAGKALREVLEKFSGATLVGVINSIATRRDGGAVGRLVQLTASSDPAVAAASVHALGRIGGAEATDCLKKLIADNPSTETAHAYLACGTLALGAGDRQTAAEVFTALAAEKYPIAVRRGALTGQVMLARGPGALLLNWLDGDDPAARRVAENHLAAQSTAWLVDAARSRPLGRAMVFAEILADRGDGSARPILMEAARQKADPVLCRRAVLALAKVADREGVAVLIEALDDDATSQAAMVALSTLPSALADDPLLEAYPKAQQARREKLTNVLIERRMTKAIPLLLKLARNETDAALGDNVCSALLALGDDHLLPSLVAILLTANDRQHRHRLESTYLEIAKTYDSTVAPVIAAMRDDASTVKLLPVLGRVGGDAARRKIDEAMASPKEGFRAAGIRAICNWPDASVADQLDQLASQDKDPQVRTIALRAYIRVVSLKSERPAAATLAMLQKAYALAEHPEDKQFAVQRADAVRDLKTLRWLVGVLDEPTVREEACRSIVELAHHRDLRNPNREEFARALKKVIDLSKAAETIRRAKGYLEGV